MSVESQAEPPAAENQGAAVYRSLDELLGYWAARRPCALALAGASIGAGRRGAPSQARLTWAAAEAAVSRLDAVFRTHGLQPGDIVAIQLPNCVEQALAILAALRAGLTASPMPLLWRGSELLRAFSRAPVKAVITCGAFRQFDHGAVMRRATAAYAENTGDPPPLLFGFGPDLQDGVLRLDAPRSRAANGAFAGGNLVGGSLTNGGLANGGATGEAGLFAPDGEDWTAPRQNPFHAERFDQDRPGLLSWGYDRESGPIAIIRSRRELVTAGLAVALALDLGGADRLLTPYGLSGLTGLAAGLAPCLITGASLLLHAPFDQDAFLDQIRDDAATVAAAPAAILAAMARGAAPAALSRLLCVLPSPHSPAPEAAPLAGIPLFTVRNLREFALVVRRFSANEDRLAMAPGVEAALAPGAAPAPLLEMRIRRRNGKATEPPVCPAGCDERQQAASQPSAAQQPSGELYVRGASTPHSHARTALWPDVAPLNPVAPLKCDADGFIGTGIPCAAHGPEEEAPICLPDPDLACHGGQLVDIRRLDRIYAEFPDFLDAAAFTIDDPVMGERIFAAIVPLPGAGAPEGEFRGWLEALDMSPVGFPEKLIAVSVIPRDCQGRVLRSNILSEI